MTPDAIREAMTDVEAEYKDRGSVEGAPAPSS